MTSRKEEKVTMFPVLKYCHNGPLWGCSKAMLTCCTDSSDWCLWSRTVGLEIQDVPPNQWPLWQEMS